MERKRLLVLANSLKKIGRCVAGREIHSKKPLKVGNWCRPISDDRPEGELLPRHMQIDRGGVLCPLEIISVPFTKDAENPVHPEDWVVSLEAPWERAGAVERDVLPELVESPPSLWLQSEHGNDRVSTAFIKASANHQSIFLIRPENLRLRLWKEDNQQNKIRTVFEYRGTTYSLRLTDPVSSALYCKNFPDIGQPAKEITLPFADNCALCVSLTPALNGIHYKVIATILTLE
jgi:hypothetical protein